MACKHMNSTRPLWRIEEGLLLIVTPTKHGGFQQTSCMPLQRKSPSFHLSLYTTDQAKSFLFSLSLFNPSLYFRKKKTQNQVHAVLQWLKVKELVFFLSLFPPCTELSLESLWKIASFEQRERGTTFNRIQRESLLLNRWKLDVLEFMPTVSKYISLRGKGGVPSARISGFLLKKFPKLQKKKITVLLTK